MLSDWEHETLPVLARILALEDRRARLAATRRRSLWSRVRQRPLNPASPGSGGNLTGSSTELLLRTYPVIW